MAKVIMIQGTMSGAGKSLLVAGLCRIFRQDGYRVSPFKSQNMALNSFITDEGLEMGRAQVMQAEAAGIRPQVCMNPVLLKPTDNTGSQVIVNGEVLGVMSARDYFAFKKNLVPEIVKAFQKLEENADIIVIEGAGSPAEINLKENDIVNMGMAKLVDAPVLLVGDIDRGGVFAQLLGTLMLLEEDERQRVKGLVINKFRGDKTILDSGIEMLKQKSGVDVTGTVPYMDIRLEDEDSLSERFAQKKRKTVDLAVVRFPRISNFTDFNVFEQFENVSVRYVTRPQELEGADMIILPGSKNTVGDLKWMRQNGIEAMIKKMSQSVPVFGICGGFQMLGESIEDPDGVEEGGMVAGAGLLPVKTVLRPQKTRCQKTGRINETTGLFEALSGLSYEGYEIHMGETNASEVIVSKGSIYGTYLHGIFDQRDIAECVIMTLAKAKGADIRPGGEDVSKDAASDLNGTSEGGILNYAAFKEKEYDRMADILREHLDMEKIYGMLRESAI